MLATGPAMSRSRSWLMDHLWSDRSPDQASGSLRQSLREIRKALGKDKQKIVSGQSMVRLDAEHVWIDGSDDAYLSKIAASSDEELEFLSNIDINDREFEHWVRDKRQYFAERIETLRSQLPIGRRNKTPADSSAPTILRGTATGSDRKWGVFSEILSDLVCKSLGDFGPVRVVGASDDRSIARSKQRHAIRLDSRAFAFADRSGAGVTLTRQDDNSVIFQTLRAFGDCAKPSLEQLEALQLVNAAADRATQEFTRMYPLSDDRRHAASLGYDGIQRLFQFRFNELEQIDRQFAEAFEMDRKAAYLVWRAYLRTFILGERPDVPADRTMEEIRSLTADAMQLDPGNSLVLALCAFITSMWLLDHAAGLELARRSVELNPANPLGVAYLGLSYLHLGDLEKGYKYADKAHRISGPGSYRNAVTFIAMTAAAYSGRHAEAIGLGEALTRAAPQFGATQRMLGLLYRKIGREADSERIVETLRKSEPNFSFKLMKDGMYRSAIVRKTELMKSI
jgi:tetratricopeptide (TPR) repeat protein